MDIRLGQLVTGQVNHGEVWTAHSQGFHYFFTTNAILATMKRPYVALNRFVDEVELGVAHFVS